jgi:hypothetical protein
MGSIPNGSAPLQACARLIFNSNASGPHREGASCSLSCPQCLKIAVVLEKPSKVFRYIDRKVWSDAKKNIEENEREMKRKNLEIESLKQIEQEPDEQKKRIMSWRWHNK